MVGSPSRLSVSGAGGLSNATESTMTWMLHFANAVCAVPLSPVKSGSRRAEEGPLCSQHAAYKSSMRDSSFNDEALLDNLVKGAPSRTLPSQGNGARDSHSMGMNGHTTRRAEGTSSSDNQFLLSFCRKPLPSLHAISNNQLMSVCSKVYGEGSVPSRQVSRTLTATLTLVIRSTCEGPFCLDSSSEPRYQIWACSLSQPSLCECRKRSFCCLG